MPPEGVPLTDSEPVPFVGLVGASFFLLTIEICS